MDDIPSNNIWKYYEHDNPNILLTLLMLLNPFLIPFFKNSNYILFKDKINFKHPGGEGFIEHQYIAAECENIFLYFFII
tara:strand:- start:3761 stop:3997 length:237 start_codon:yes stop_codon:yes gene_type:complete